MSRAARDVSVVRARAESAKAEAVTVSAEIDPPVVDAAETDHKVDVRGYMPDAGFSFN